MHRLILLAIVLVTACVSGAVPSEARRFEDPERGFSILLPKGWREYPSAEMAKWRRGVSFENETAREAIQEGLTASLISFAKYPPPSSGRKPEPGRGIMNPSIQIDFQPAADLAGTMPVEIMRMLTEDYPTIFEGFRVIDPVREIDVGGLQAAHASFAYVLTLRDGGSTGVIARKWIIPRGDGLISIDMVGPAEGSDVCEEEFRAAADSIRFEY